MNLVKFALQRPFTILSAVLCLCFLGAAVVSKIPADILPDFKKPVIVSFFSYPGLPTGEMEKSVTSRVERALTLAGKREAIESRTLPGATIIKVTFQAGADPSAAMNDIVNMQASDMFHLPPGIEWPFTLRSEPANLPVMLAAISGEGLSETEMYKIGYYAVRNKLGGLPGVQIPHPFGGKFRQMMVYVDPVKLAAYHIAPTDVVDALEKSNLVMAGGSMKIGDFEYQIHPVNTLPFPADIDNVVITIRDGRPIYIRDVGYTQDDAALQYNIVRVNGERSVYCPLLREPGENTIQVVDRIVEGMAKEIPLMKGRGDIPEATQITLVSDQSTYIRKAISHLTAEVGLGALLVVLVVIFFLRKLRASIAVLIMLPLSLLTGILGFFFTGQSLNVMTLGGLALAVGTVVDAGIVVVENIMRHRAMGKNSATAAEEGASEVATPVLAGTITTLAVFIPALFLTGMIKFLFVPLALAACLTIGSSYLIAMTVAPAFCARFLGKDKISKTDRAAASEENSAKPRNPYERLLRGSLKVAPLTIVIIGGAAIASFFLLPAIGTELFPDVDAGTFEIRMKTDPGTRLENTEKVVERVENAIADIIPPEEIKSIISNIGLPVGKGAGFSTILSSNSGPDTAYLIVNLDDDGRSTSVKSYVEQLRASFAEKFPDEKFLFVTGGIINAALNEGVAAPIDIQVSAGTLEACRVGAERIENAIRDVKGAADVQIAQMLDYPQLDIEVDRERAAFFGISQEDVARNVTTALSSSTNYKSMIWVDPNSGTDFFMGVQFADNESSSLDELRNIPIAFRTKDGPKVMPLSNLAHIKRVNIPGEISHNKITRVNDVYVNVENRDLGSVTADIEAIIAEMEFPNGTAVEILGPVATMREGARMLGFGLLTAAVIVFLVLMAQFKSFVDPLIIMISVPLGLAGVVLILFLTGTTLNIQSLMGTLMLIGVVVNNSILLVEFANAERERGRSSFEAAFAAARVRLRPILMTAAVLVASMLPFAFQFTLGNEAMIPLARALIGGMIVSTVLTLFLVPCVYTLVKKIAINNGPQSVNA